MEISIISFTIKFFQQEKEMTQTKKKLQMNGLTLVLWTLGAISWGLGFLSSTSVCSVVFNTKILAENFPIWLCILSLVFTTAFPLFIILGLGVLQCTHTPRENSTTQGVVMELVRRAEPVRRVYHDFLYDANRSSDDSSGTDED